jgi:hypothetical protein
MYRVTTGLSVGVADGRGVLVKTGGSFVLVMGRGVGVAGRGVEDNKELGVGVFSRFV